jgi:hypothetical protein
MNKKKIATNVLKHPLIQEIIKQEIASPSTINRLIVNEVLSEDELEEARTPEQKKIVSKIANLINRKLSPKKQPDLEKWTAALKAVEAGENPGITGWDDLSDEQKNYALQTLKNSARFKKAQSQAQQPAKSTAKIASEISTAADLIALGLMATGAGAPAAFIAKGAGTIASIVEAVAEYKDGIKGQAITALLGIIPIGKLPFAKKFAGKILGSLAKSPVAKEALELAIKTSIKNLSGSKEEAKGKLENAFGSEETAQVSPRSSIDSDFDYLNQYEESIFNFLLEKPDAKLMKWLASDEKLKKKFSKEEKEQLRIIFSNTKEKIEKELTRKLTAKDRLLLTTFIRNLFEKNLLSESMEDFIKDLGIEQSTKDVLEATGVTPEQIQLLKILLTREDGKKIASDTIEQFRRKQKPPVVEPKKTDTEEEPQQVTEPEKTDAEEQPDTTAEKEKVKQATEEATKEENVESDFDQSSPEIPNLRYDEYRDSLDWFFGMRDDKKTSFMKAFFLSHQVDLLHNKLLRSLESIKAPPSFEERALTRDQAEEQPEQVNEQQESEAPIQLSRKNKISLKRELADQADLLLDAKKIATAYRKYGTQKNLDAEFDGSSLERQLKTVLGEVQKHNARLISTISKISDDYQKAETLQEQAEAELTREQKIDEIEKVYKQLGNFYKNNLRVSLENKDFKKAAEAADKMLDLVKPIIKFFPRTIVHSTSGKIITLSDAIKNLDGKIKTYKRVLRDIYMTVKDDEVSPIQLSRMLIQITQLCESIDEQFDVPCVINEREKKNATDNLPEQEQALTAIVTMDPEDEEELAAEPEEEPQPEEELEDGETREFKIANPRLVDEFLIRQYGPDKFEDLSPEEYRTLIRLFVATKIQEALQEDYGVIKGLGIGDPRILNARLFTADRERLREMGQQKIKDFLKAANIIYKTKPFVVITDAEIEQQNVDFLKKIMNKDFYEKKTSVTNENLISILKPIIEQMLGGKNG